MNPDSIIPIWIQPAGLPKWLKGVALKSTRPVKRREGSNPSSGVYKGPMVKWLIYKIFILATGVHSPWGHLFLFWTFSLVGESIELITRRPGVQVSEGPFQIAIWIKNYSFTNTTHKLNSFKSRRLVNSSLLCRPILFYKLLYIILVIFYWGLVYW